MLDRLRLLRSRYFNDLEDTLVDIQPPTGAAPLTDTNSVETEAAQAAASEDLDAEVRSAVIELYRRCLARYEYVKEANDKFLAMLDEGLLQESNIVGEEERKVRAYAESLTLDPVEQPMTVPQYEAEDMVDEAQALTQTEAVLYGDGDNMDNPSAEKGP